MTAGRPTKYDPSYCEELITHMEMGLSYTAFAGKISVSKQTLYDWEKVYPEFLDAKRVALEKGRLFWEEAMIERLHDSQGFNTTAWVFTMKNRFGWRDKVESEVKTTMPVMVNVVNADEES